MQETMKPYPSDGLFGLYRTLSAFPIACFSLTLLSDLAYLQTSNLLFLHFSEWLLLAGLVFGVLAGLAAMISLIAARVEEG